MKTMRLTEKDLYNMISNAVNSVLNEGTNNKEYLDDWYYIKDTLGADEMVDALYHYLNQDTIENFCDFAHRVYDFPKENSGEEELE